MKLHDPETEKALLRLAEAGRKGSIIEAKDRRRFGGSIGRLVAVAYGSAVFLTICGISNPDLREIRWQTLYASLLLMLAVFWSSGALASTAQRCGCHDVLLNLPISGRRALRWVRHRYFIRQWLPVLFTSALCALPLRGFSFDSGFAALSLAFVASVFTTVVVYGDPGVQRLRLPLLWMLSTFGILAILALMYFVDSRTFHINGASPATMTVVSALAWLYPSSWVTPQMMPVGGVLAAIGFSWGFQRWLTWPTRLGHSYDAPQDFIDAFEDPDGDDFDESIEATAEPHKPVVLTDEIALPAPRLHEAEGWLNRWVGHRCSRRERLVTGAISELETSGGFRLKIALLAIPLWLAGVWIFMRVAPDSSARDLQIIWIWVLSAAGLLLTLFPFTNGVPLGTGWCETGSLAMPSFAGLPITVRELLRTSQRITTRRSLLMMAIGTPVVATLFHLLPGPGHPWMACWLVPAVLTWWILSRPVFVWHRLQSASRRRSGVLLQYLTVNLVLAVLLLGWLIAGFAGIFLGIVAFSPTVIDAEAIRTGAAAIGAILASGLLARGVFEIYHRQLRLGTYDWLKPLHEIHQS